MFTSASATQSMFSSACWCAGTRRVICGRSTSWWRPSQYFYSCFFII